MAELDTSMPEPTWLKPAQTDQSGFLTALSQRQTKRQVDMREREFNTMLPFKIREAELDAQERALKIEGLIAAREDDQLDKASSVSVLSAMAKVTDWSDPDALKPIYEVIKSRPSKAGLALLMDAEARHQKAVESKIKWEQTDNLATYKDQQIEVLKQRVEAQKDIATIQSKSREAVATTRGEYSLDAATIKGEYNLDAVQARINQASQRATTSITDKAKLAKYQAELHTIWSDFATDAKQKQQAIDSLDSKYGISSRMDVSGKRIQVISPDGKPGSIPDDQKQIDAALKSGYKIVK